MHKKSIQNINSITLYYLIFSVFCGLSQVIAQVEEVWHTPYDSRVELYGSTMRDPLNPGINNSITFYQGINKYEGANQTGGALYYKIDDGAWQSESLQWNNDFGELQFWKYTLELPSSIGSQVQYYFLITFENNDDTYLYSGNGVDQNEPNSKSLEESTAQETPYSFSISESYSSPALFTANGVNSNYATLNYYIDEINDSNYPTLELSIKPGVPDITEVEIFTNLNNRDRTEIDWDENGIEDGIIPPDGNNISVTDTECYFQAYEMAPDVNGNYILSLPIEKTGAYRVTGRFRSVGQAEWTWLREQGIRDLAVVVAPRSALDMTMYELHVTNANAKGPTFEERGTFEDLHNSSERVNLEWINNLGINWIWFQPFHPQSLDGNTGGTDDPGSPYSIRNFWEINPLYTSNYDEDLSNPTSNSINYLSAMQAFQNFVFASDNAGVNLMLDFPFNHTAPDVVLSNKGVEIFGGIGNPNGWQSNDLIRDRVPTFFSTNGEAGDAAYSAPAQVIADIASAPDRTDFGKWSDVRDVYFGNYSTLVTGNPDKDTSLQIIRNEDDLMFYDTMGSQTINVWRYFGSILPYWIEKSGHRGFNSTNEDGDASSRITLDSTGIDGLRKDFGQGLPPQAMEYIINRAHSVKWNFVFMSESLDGEEVTYRSSRHFPILNENIVFDFKSAANAQSYRNIFESRRANYGDSLILLNNTSHDEEPWVDPWQPLIRYANASTNDGVPMIMYGQEIGASQKSQDSQPQGSWDYYEINFSKVIPSFKRWNSLQPQWTVFDNNDSGVQHLYPVYSAIGKARQSSPALRSTNRWFLNRYSDGLVRDDIHAVAKYTNPGNPLSTQDVVFAFVNLNRDTSSIENFAIPTELAEQIGLDANRNYNVKNIAAYAGRSSEFLERRTQWLWGPDGRTGQDLLDNGIFVDLNPVPLDEDTWETSPYEAQFLKFYDVTPPTATPEQPSTSRIYDYVIGNQASFSWIDLSADTSGIVPQYEVFITKNDLIIESFVTASSNFSVVAEEGDTISLAVRAVNPNNNASVGPLSANSKTITLISENGDEDGDGKSNYDEDLAGTDPLDSSSRFVIASHELGTDGSFTITWDPVAGKTYKVQVCDDLKTGIWSDIATNQTFGNWTHTPTNSGQNFYRIVVE